MFGSDPLSTRDASGLCEADVHQFLTQFLAEAAGFSKAPHALVFHVVRRSASLERFTLEALEWFRRSHGVNPRRLRSSGEVRTADQLAELEPEVARLAALTAAGGSRLRAALANETPN